MEVKFYEQVPDSKLKFAVIIARSNGKFVFCKHKERDTLELPGGHREECEAIHETARRELTEETGAYEFSITPICVYSVTGKNRVNQSGEETYGMLYYAEVRSFAEINSEIERICLLDEPPDNWTYPLIQPKLLQEAQRRGIICA